MRYASFGFSPWFMRFKLVAPAKVAVVPLWLPILLFGIFPLYRIGLYLLFPGHRRRMESIAANIVAEEPAPILCPFCQYDLRATPRQCPECGAMADKIVAAMLAANRRADAIRWVGRQASVVNIVRGLTVAAAGIPFLFFVFLAAYELSAWSMGDGPARAHPLVVFIGSLACILFSILAGVFMDRLALKLLLSFDWNSFPLFKSHSLPAELPFPPISEAATSHSDPPHHPGPEPSR
jgi:hypothetical protein